MNDRVLLFRSPDFDAEPGVAVDDDGRPWGADVALAVADALARAGLQVSAPRAQANGWTVSAVHPPTDAGGRTRSDSAAFAVFVQRAPVRVAPAAPASDHWVIQVSPQRSWWGRAGVADPAPLCAAIVAGISPVRISDARWVSEAEFRTLI